ncbi:MAG: NAD(P)-dependent alcohol dehydrogenase [Acidimicrobiia bacterium]|nr:NAD(P)-dependent alcohol dehydrogenase [Acidimicrobiia bacterium]
MKAVVYDRYGPPEVLRVEDVPIPVPKPTQVLVEIAATSINLSDWEVLRGTPLYARIGGLRSPAQSILGSDIAGRVVAIGSEVTRFQDGDEVYGRSPFGGFAEFAVASERSLTLRPDHLTPAQASTLPEAGTIALQGTASLQPGQRLAINGAGGGSGAFAIQLAKNAGADVTAIDNAGKLDFMRSLGADRVVDYRTEDYTRLGPFDRILDLVATRSVFAVNRALTTGGTYRCVGGPVPAMLRMWILGAVVGRVSRRNIGVLMVNQSPKHFEPLADLVAHGEVDIHIERTFPLDQLPEALAHVGEGRALGKVVVTPG